MTSASTRLRTPVDTVARPRVDRHHEFFKAGGVAEVLAKHGSDVTL